MSESHESGPMNREGQVTYRNAQTAENIDVGPVQICFIQLSLLFNYETRYN